MKKLLILSTIVGLSACANPDFERPYPGGPTYYKVPQCTQFSAYPKSYRRLDSSTGFVDTYMTPENTIRTHCNYNVYQSLNSVYLYGTSK